MNTQKGPARIALMVAGGIVLATALAFLFGFFVKILWNWLMPDIFGLPMITYWQAWGLVLLAHILFKAGHNQHPGHPGKRTHDDSWRDRIRERFAKESEPNSTES